MKGCANDPRTRLSPDDQAAVAEFEAHLVRRAQERTADDEHRWQQIGPDYRRCLDCDLTESRSVITHHQHGAASYVEWGAPDGRRWHTGLDGQVWPRPGGPNGVPTCPPPDAEALCPWDDNAFRHAGAWGDAQLDTAMRTWCDRHERAVSECVEPGPYCPGRDAHLDGESGGPGPCTGREDTCRCMCPACCGDTPDVYGHDGD